ncbi:phosphatase PAP2 family protein [Cellulomonas fengjieae]|uniref:phosphatase PAP2 family protein n=1 Tax=Cellulomonas fengjieae TaxID=2819978 RepID=UPI001AAFCD32|nr:phosphatase PAP2 family protein [Cellulomonas fengjieae]MBO3102176.1 phosphatase PAP2 family protein [Cellulomonas fengjieae]
MHTFLHRYELDSSAPTRKEAWHDFTRRVLLPAVGLWVVIVGIGLLITGPLGNLPGEAAVNEWFVAQRTETLDAVTAVLSAIGTTEFIIGACVLFVALFWWRTKQWWLALVPPQAIAVQAIIFMTAALVVGRERPEVEKLDESPPTSSFPSGHTGASTAFYVVLAMLAQRIGNPVLRGVVTVVCLLIPLAVGTARLYRGMHSLSDVIVGLLNGLVCAFLAWNYLRRDTSSVAARSESRSLSHS